MASINTAPHPIRDQYFKTFFVASDNAINYEKFTWFETLWQEPATFILLMASTIFGKISFIVLVPGQGYRPPTVRIRWTTAGLWTALPERKRMWTARERLGVVSTSAASVLEQDEEDQDTVSDRGKFKRRTESMTSTRSLYNRFEYKLPSWAVVFQFRW